MGAAIKFGQKLAKECESDPCCNCKKITVKFDAISDANVAANGRSSIENWNAGVKAALEIGMRPKIVGTDDFKVMYPNYEVPKQSSAGVKTWPSVRDQIVFKVSK